MVVNKHSSTNNTISYNAMISSKDLNTFFGDKKTTEDPQKPEAVLELEAQ